RFWERLDLVDMIASDHAPHTLEEKAGTKPPPGVPGLETNVCLLLAAVDEGRLSYERMVELVHTAPLRVYGLLAPEDSSVTIDMSEGRYTLPRFGFKTRAGWSPFEGLAGLGRVQTVRLRNCIVWQDGELCAEPGQGRPLRRSRRI
ncbi:MAG: dihydroorotase, partial [Chloroflexi bacterium]|nr:dihydroorotase [Chloroflexota bacterium]